MNFFFEHFPLHEFFFGHFPMHEFFFLKIRQVARLELGVVTSYEQGTVIPWLARIFLCKLMARTYCTRVMRLTTVNPRTISELLWSVVSKF